MNVPNFFLAGAPKTGTTSLHRYLRQHPQVYLNPIKEPMFFAMGELCTHKDYRSIVDRERAALQVYLDGPQVDPAQFWVTEWDDYVRMFRNVREQIAIGEASGYLWVPSAAGAIRSRVPGAKLIFMLRDPAEQLFSWYLLALWRAPHLTFHAWLDETMNGRGHSWPVMEGGRFATNLQRFFDMFPRDHIRIYLYESFRADPRPLLRDMFGFLGVDPDHPIDVSHRHNETRPPRFPLLVTLRRRLVGEASLTWWLPAPARRAVKGFYSRSRGSCTMDPGDRALVIDYYRDEILRTADLIGRDLSAWLR